jgi:hypothetical protein
MRLILTWFFVVFFSINCLAQTFSMSDLIAMAKMDDNNLDTYLTKRGYVYLEGETYGHVKSISYALDYNLKTEKAKKFLTKRKLVKDTLNSINISYLTLEKSEYLNIKSQIVKLGFKYNRSEISNTSQSFFYVKESTNKKSTSIEIIVSSSSFEINFKKAWFEDY